MKKKVLSVPAALVMLLCVFMANPVTGYCAATDDDIIVFSEDDSSESSGDTKKQDADAADSSKAQESTAAQSQDTDSRETQSQDTQNSDSQSEDSTSSDKTDEGSQNQAQDDGDFTIDGKAYVLSERYTDSEIPKGFERSKLSIHGGTYDELVGNGLTLVYLKPADNIEGSGQFYIYDREKDSVSPFVKLGKKTHYCILLQPDKLINKGLIEEKLERKGVEYTAYRFPEIKNRFYYVYGKDENGDALWYEYDTEKNRVFLANSELLKAYKSTGKAASKQTDDTTASSDDSTDSSKLGSKADGKIKKMSSNPRAIAAILIVILAVGMIILVNAVLFKRGLKEIDEEEDEIPEEDDEPVSDADDFLGVDEELLHADDFEDLPKESNEGYNSPIDETVHEETLPEETEAVPNIDDALDHTLSSAMWSDDAGDDLDVLDLNDL